MPIWRYPPIREYKARDPTVTSRMMSAVKSKGSKAELLLRHALWRRGYRYRLHHTKLIGKPDIVFSRFRVVVFVDSDFWHARTLISEGEPALRATIRGERQDWWIAKLRRNAARDAKVTERLMQDEWRVVRIWESEVIANPEVCANYVESFFREERGGRKRKGRAGRQKLRATGQRRNRNNCQ